MAKMLGRAPRPFWTCGNRHCQLCRWKAAEQLQFRRNQRSRERSEVRRMMDEHR